jgi:pimeloyl-ACP methyl ester carboxylesterase
MTALAQAGFFVAAPDQRGYGDSDKPSGVAQYSVTRLADDVASLVRELGREKAFVAGHDIGGGVAWATAMIRPEVVERLATLNSVHPVGFERQARHWSQLRKSWYLFFFQLPWLPEKVLSRRDFAFVRRSLADDGLSSETIGDLLEGIRPPGALRASVDWYRAVFRDGLAKRLAPRKVDVPVLSIWGDGERHLDPELAEPPPDWVSRARVVRIAGASHWVQHDAPDEVGALLIEHFGADGGRRLPLPLPAQPRNVD